MLALTPDVAKFPLAKAVLKVTVPETVKLSETVVVPPAESIVRLPDDVVTVFAFSDILSTAADPVTVRSPVNVSFASDLR